MFFRALLKHTKELVFDLISGNFRGKGEGAGSDRRNFIQYPLVFLSEETLNPCKQLNYGLQACFEGVKYENSDSLGMLPSRKFHPVYVIKHMFLARLVVDKRTQLRSLEYTQSTPSTYVRVRCSHLARFHAINNTNTLGTSH